MSVKSKSFSPSLKSKILKESFSKGCIISDLARSYSLPPKTLYAWRSKMKKISCLQASPYSISSSSQSSSHSLAGKFVEIKFKESENDVGGNYKNHDQDHDKFQEPKIVLPKKAIIIYEDYSLSIEGKIDAKILLSMMGKCVRETSQKL